MRARGPRLRRRGREPDRGDRARGRRPRLDRGPGRLRLRDRPQRRRARQVVGGAPSRRRGSPTPTSSPAPPRPRRRAARRSPGLSDPASPSGRRREEVELAQAVERAAREADQRVVGVEQAVYADSASGSRSPPRPGVAGAFEATSAYAYLQAIAEGDGDRRPGSASAWAAAPAALDPEAIGREAARARRRRCSAPRKPESRTCPVVLDPTVAASFVGFIGGDPVRRRRAARPLAVRRAASARRSPARRSSSPTTASTPPGLDSSPFDGEGVPRRRTPLIEGGRLRTYLTTPTPPAAAATESTGNAARAGYRSPPSVSTSNLVVGAGEGRPRGAARRGRRAASTSPTSPACTRASTRSPAPSRSAPPAAMIAGGELADPVREFTIACDLVSDAAGGRRRRRARRAGSRSAARSGPRRC